MKNHILLLSVVAVLCITGCSGQDSNKSNNSGDSGDISSESLDKNTFKNENFTINIPEDLSSMSPNCKKYIDDMREQQARLLEERGPEADYYINDLYGNDGVDITKGVLPSTGNYQDNTGGYRDGVTENEYLDPIGADYTKGEKSDENKGIEIKFSPSESLKDKEYTIKYSTNSSFSDAETITTTNTSIRIKNLLVNQEYYLSISVDGKSSPVANFTTGDYPRWIDARPMFNVRDHGGYMTSSGQRIRQGLIFRGGEINAKSDWYGTQQYTDDTGKTNARDGHIITQTDEAKAVFRNVMNMVGGLEIDLRSSSERNGYSACGFAENGDINYKLISISSYYNGMKNNTSLIKQCFDAFAEADEHPVYYHCYGGADRTGTIGFLLGAMLGMSYTDLVIDFELTSYSSNPSRNYRGHLRNGPWNDWPGLVDYLQNTLGWNSSTTIKDGAEKYLKEKCNVSQDTIDKIREIMLVNA